MLSPVAGELPGSGTDLVPAASGRAGQAPAAVAAAYLGQLAGSRPVRLGSRTSPMAMAQARHVAGLLAALVPGLDVTISGINTSADQWAGDLAALGGKGLFVKEIDRALLMGEVDAAVHCMKDVPGDVPLPPGLAFAAYLPREDIRDCLVFPASSALATLADLPAGARIGTSSVRRKASLAATGPTWPSTGFAGTLTPGCSGSTLASSTRSCWPALAWHGSGTQTGRPRPSTLT